MSSAHTLSELILRQVTSKVLNVLLYNSGILEASETSGKSGEREHDYLDVLRIPFNVSVLFCLWTAEMVMQCRFDLEILFKET